MYMTTSTYTNKVDEILRNDNYLLNLIGKAPRYFRFPYLDYDNTALKIVNSLNKIAVDINLDSLDWKYDNVQTEMNLVTDAFNANPNGGFVQLSHEFPSTTLNFLKANVDFWKSKGYSFVTAEQCTGAGSAYM